jgi:hypothetical protein
MHLDPGGGDGLNDFWIQMAVTVLILKLPPRINRFTNSFGSGTFIKYSGYDTCIPVNGYVQRPFPNEKKRPFGCTLAVMQ